MPLTEARQKALHQRSNAALPAKAVTLESCVLACIGAHQAGRRNANKHADQ